ncbi:non-hydrolyzing UDP-N-acetylglucosamine 2-epimerase [Sedimenticola selenatireducens]|uniref:UDP-N-acetylglucosamine 2-epimerase n=1 Tax=Sedimenticola selenatireducens TaxID=191960 RepID=A0A558DUL3_9GAMM|nr:UDP-N-acetylglucosamine 2-epimerase (non-hydrolyzing) [Sedimenticola selenatireducens]TVO72414.1 UDP-N-acetylglucosamine 2-epimerase (non-hydrolyzing) [Sedimenticola selenatireducens]TVT64669.1 MAG: UDP-N-acetylglucosamine 2-epimerase (non-hydrolyzing) [Sedimenticola selenatireducens]
MKNILVAFGTRPEAIKMAPVIQALKDHPNLHPIVCVTAQHREMLDQTLELFEITPDIDLNLMRPNQGLATLSARILENITPVLVEHQPDAVLVQGDTTTTFMTALASFYQQIPIGHIEAGLRTGDLRAPFPEEANRVLTSHLAQWHFAPTENNKAALLAENIPPEQIFITGNTVIDALLWIQARINRGIYSEQTKALLARRQRPFILVTGHRRESFGQGFEEICQAIKLIAASHPELDIVYPVHLNPNVQEPVERILGNLPNIHLIEPLGYEPFAALMGQCLFVLTDSGGVQEEAPSLGKPVLVMRTKTERTEALKAGVRLVGTDSETIVKAAYQLLNDATHFRQMSTAVNPYGDGTAAIQIVSILAKQLLDTQA